MPRRWRLRNKLLLGIGLVVGSIALLVLGTVHGLTSYLSTVNTADSKLAELLELDKLKLILANLISPAPVTPVEGKVFEKQEGLDPGEKRRILEGLRESRKEFEIFKALFQDTIARHRDPDPYTENRLIEDAENAFTQLEKAVDEHYAKPFTFEENSAQAAAGIRGNQLVQEKHQKFLQLIDRIRSAIADDMYNRIHQARKQYIQAMWIAGVSTSLALLLLLALAYLFTKNVLKPIKILQAGVQRVAASDFYNPIVLGSGDELEELGDAFNNMTRRLREILLDLERQVNERSRQLVRSERMVSVGFLAAGVAHEINNPLASIAFCSEALQSRLSEYIRRYPQEAEVVAKYLTMIQQEAFRCKEITSKLLEFSRVGEVRRTPTDLAELIQSVLEIAQHLQNCRGKRILFQPYARVMASVSDQDLKSVVLNLVVNALDSMEEGGILTITLQAKGTDAEMMFTDTGCGMSPDVLQNIFEPFFTRSRTGKGTGLGLFISHQIIDQHGGEIHASSAGPKLGSTFTVRVPLQATQKGGDGKDADVLPMMRPTRPGTGTPQMEDGRGHAAA